MRIHNLIFWICVCVSSCVVKFVESACPPNGYYNVSSFGETCSYQCHCKNNEQCDATSGECQAGCARGWMGPGCQYRNISPKHKGTQNRPGTVVETEIASLAVDGDVSTCIKTGTNHQQVANGRHYWRVAFDRDFYIVGLKLYIKQSYKESYRGFRVEAGETSTSFPTLCYEHPDSPGVEVMKVMCTSPVVTRHLRVILRDQFVRMALCEVEIYGGRQVSFKEVTEQSSTLFWSGNTWNSSKAVDGRPQYSNEKENDAYKTCSATEENTPQTHWWRLQLPSTLRIEEIYVYSRATRTYLYQTAGFSLNISQSGGASSWIHNDTNTGIISSYLPREIDVVPPVDGQFINISLVRILVLCEIEVFAECLPGWCGWDCRDVCHCSEVTTGTYRKKGVCPNGCEGRWTGPDDRCDHECTETQWGPYCTNTCGQCHHNQVCNVGNGHCPGGCIVSRKPPLCAERCDDGTYGQDCLSSCGNCTGHGPCDKETGSCDQGCEPGLQWPLCKKACHSGTYGKNCSFSCGNCSGGDTCDVVDGKCPAGCADVGIKPPLCSETCRYGTYGSNCTSTCGNCVEGQACHHQTGVCQHGCSDGYLGETCDKACNPGSFGSNCTFKCGFCDLENCTHTNGTCPYGCKSDYEGVLCLSLKDTPSNVGAIIGGIVGGLVVVAVVGVALFIYRRRNVKREAHDEKLDVIKSELVSNEPSVNSIPIVPAGPVNIGNQDNQEDNAIEYYNASPSKDIIQVVDLQNFCTEMRCNPSKLVVEFAGLKQGLQYSTDYALKLNNRAKNRYKEMYTYDKTRVHLPTIEGQVDSDYINASYIIGYANTPRTYIACQGTMDNTVSDMWRMIWSENIKTVVMLTGCYEGGRLKCVQYWPEGKSDVYGEITVEIASEKTYAEFVIRKFRCKKAGVSPARVVYQYHYLAWPDKDTPDTELSLVQFWRTVKSAKHAGVKPWVVHCSAGVGRTGTFIALDYLYNQGRADGAVDINGCVHELREQRTLMVQTKDQYVYLHMALAEALFPIGNVCKTDKYQAYFKTLQTSNKHKLRKIFQRLLDEINSEANETENLYGNINTGANKVEDIYSGSKLAGNINKSRNFQIIPPDVFRPRIQLDPNVAGSDYVNAVYISSFNTKNKMIMTQIPLENTVVDFFRLLWEMDLTLVVLMETDVTMDDVYWPTDEQIVTHGQFTLSLRDEQKTDHYTRLSLQLSQQEGTREITILQFTFWPRDNLVPIERSSLIHLITEVETLKRESGSGNPVVVQCLDGATRSGLFTVIWGVLERMTVDRDVAVTETIRQMRYRRSQIIPTFEQFQFCHEAVSDYIENDKIYANLL